MTFETWTGGLNSHETEKEPGVLCRSWTYYRSQSPWILLKVTVWSTPSKVLRPRSWDLKIYINDTEYISGLTVAQRERMLGHRCRTIPEVFRKADKIALEVTQQLGIR